MFTDAFQNYILENWILILILVAFVIVLATTSFLDNKATRRLYIIIAFVFLLSISVFAEFYIKDHAQKDATSQMIRTVLIAVRYSSTPLILALIIFALIKKMRPFIFIPAGVLLILNIVSIFTGIIFSIDETTDKLVRGPVVLAYLPFIIAGLYCAFLIYILIKRSNKRAMEIIPIIFLATAFISDLVFPFVFKDDFSKIFCSTIAAALFIYYVFSILQSTKKDALTGLLNRQTYYGETNNAFKDITAIISLDINGLKKINDTYGHNAGDEALVTLAICFSRACKANQSAYRMGGDEFAIVCYKTSEEEVVKLVERINKYVSETKYTCSIGYSYQKGGFTNLDDLLKDSDEKMYKDKAEFYRRQNEK